MLLNLVKCSRIAPALKELPKFYSARKEAHALVRSQIHSVDLSRCKLHKLVSNGNRFYSSFRRNHDRNPNARKAHKSVIYYTSAVIVLGVGLTYAAVPLYRIFCQAYSSGGAIVESQNVDLTNMKKIRNREIDISFVADVNASLQWNFKPQQSEIKVIPGETVLAFYTAENPSDKPVVGVSTYNVLPFEAGQYFNKIQCFCFEEQLLNPHEQVDMPVFFYIDPEFNEDPRMENVENIVLSYTFFEVKEGMNLPFPSYYTPHKK